MSKRKYINALAKHFCNSLHIASHDLKKMYMAMGYLYKTHYNPKEV